MESTDFSESATDSRNKHRHSKTHNKRLNVRETIVRNSKINKRQVTAGRKEEKEAELVQARWDAEKNKQSGGTVAFGVPEVAISGIQDPSETAKRIRRARPG